MKTKTALIVDDSKTARTLLRTLIEKKFGYRVCEAATGEAGLRILRRRKIDLVILDIILPRLSGNEVLSLIRKDYDAIELPVIMVSALSENSQIIKSLKLGANDYITKPVHLRLARTRILTQLRLAKLSQEMSILKQMSALNALISTYNHKINNPLAIALGCLRQDINTPVYRKKLETALWRIAKVVKEIRKLSAKKDIEEVPYGGLGTMLKVG